MKNRHRIPLHAIGAAAAGLAVMLACAADASAQATPSGTGGSAGSGASSGTSAPTGGTNAPANASSSAVGPSDPNPYYIGVSQAFTRDSNVYRIPDGPGDIYSSTSILGGFNQIIGRQRVFANAIVSTNRYQDEEVLDNVSYWAAAGLDWETIEHISGNLNASFNRTLATPPASGGVPVATRNIAETQTIGARIRWGGVSLLTLEAGADYSNIDYSAPEYITSESSYKSANVYLYYSGGGPLRVGAGFRGDRTDTPKAYLDPATNEYQSTQLKGQHFDVLLDYQVTGRVGANTRLSYTKQTSTGPANVDFSGFTGNIGLSWQATGKLAVRAQAARDAGFDAREYNTYVFKTDNNGGLIFSPAVGLYQNNQITTSGSIGIDYAATAKVTANLGARYGRAHLTNIDVATGIAGPEVTDVSKVYSIGANYAIARNWGAACTALYEKRDVTGGFVYSYTAKTIGCSTQFTWY